MDFPMPFASDMEQLAVTGDDNDIYRFLPFRSLAKHEHSSVREKVCELIDIPAEESERPMDRRPLDLPFLRQDLLEFRDIALLQEKGSWSVAWSTNRFVGADERYTDDFRSLIIFRTLEFMIRPAEELKHDGTEPPRLHIGWRDIHECLTLALDHNQEPQMEMETGTGYARHPQSTPGDPKDDIKFEWRIDRALQTRVNLAARRWREQACGGAQHYRDKKAAYESQVNYANLRRDRDSQQPPLFQPYVPSSQPDEEPRTRPYPVQRPGPPRTRRSKRSNTSPEPGPSRKRQSVSSQSGTSSPEESRPSSSMAGSALEDMPPPRRPVHRQMAAPPNLAQGQTPIGSPGSILSGSAYSGESGQSFGMSNMGIQSPDPNYGQPNPGGYPQQTAGGGYAQQAPGHRQPPPREYGDDLEPPMVFSRTAFGPRQTFRPETRAPVEFVHYQPQPGFPQGGRGSTPNPQGMQLGTLAPMPPSSGAHGPPGSSTSTSPPTEGNVEFERAMRQAMEEEQRSRGHPEHPYQGSQTDSQSEWTDDGSEHPRGPYYTGGGYPSGSQGSYRGGRGHYSG